MIHVNDVIYRRYCKKGSHLNSPFSINYDMEFSNDDDKAKYPLYFIFYGVFLNLISKIHNGIEIRYDNLEDHIYENAKTFIPNGIINNPSFMLRLEILSREIANKLILILMDIGDGTIVGFNQKVNVPVKTIGSHDYVYTYCDLSYVSKDGLLKIILFNPYKGFSSYNVKTSICYNYWREISDVNTITIFSFGTDISSGISYSDYSSFYETEIILDSRKSSLLESIFSSVKDTFFYSNISYDYCSQCVLRKECSFKLKSGL